VRRIALLLVCLAAGLAWAADVYKIGDEVADATLAMSDGKDVKLSSREGDVVLLFFYRVKARHAVEEAKQIDAIRKARAKQKLTVFGVARDATIAEAKTFGDDNKLGFAQAADTQSELYATFAAKGMPWIAVLDGKRKLKYSAAGMDDEAVDVALAALLGAKDPPPDSGEKKK
jgi:peroxiredoxin